MQVACFGEVLWDIFEQDGAERVHRFALGGAPANVATGLARLGVGASIVGGIGRDRFGDALEKHLADDGVDTSHLIRLPNRTGITFVRRDARGEPSFLFYRHETADVEVRARHVTRAMGKATWGLVGTSTLMTRGLRHATARFAKVLHDAGGNLVVDLNVRSHMWRDKNEMRRRVAKLVGHAALIKASAADLEALAGSDGPLWMNEHAAGVAWILTRGADMAHAYFEGGTVEVATTPMRPVDATGAGDAFLAGALAVLVRADATPGSPAFRDPRVWTRALQVGHALGAKAVSGVGSVTGLTDLGDARSLLAERLITA